MEGTMATISEKIHGIIHTTSAACAGAGVGLAQLPCSDSAIIGPLQTAMIVSIAQVHGANITKTAAADLLLTFAASITGRTLSQILFGWIPVYGNIVNASTAAGVTEAIGWAADSHFS